MPAHVESQLISGSKAALTPTVQRAVARSVVRQPQAGMASGYPLYGWGEGVVWGMAAAADGFPSWGTRVIYRDKMLRAFLPTESNTNSAFAAVIARNAAFSWKLNGPKAGQDAAHELLQTANDGAGWLDFITRLCWDLYAQDKGAFVQVIRMADNENSPVIGLQTMDSARCWLTGRVEKPVIYTDIYGKWRELKWYQVIHLTEMPAPHEQLYGLQYSAMTRILCAAQLFRNIAIYLSEKTAGRQARAIHVVSGVKGSELQQAVAGWAAHADNAGLTSYMKPIVLSTLSQDAKPTVATLEMASLPDGFDVDAEFKRFIGTLALGLGTDYQELMPLPGGGLGTGAQSQVLNEKSRGKGAALFMKIVAQALNFSGVFAPGVEFSWDEQDPSADEQAARTREIRVRTRAAAKASGELDVVAMRQQALDAGDMTQDEFDAINARDGGNPELDVTGNSFYEGQQQPTDASPGRTPRASVGRPEEQPPASKAAREVVVRLGVKAETPDGVSLRDFLISRLHRSFTIAADDMRAMGYLGTEERIKVSGLIGDVLREAELIFDAGDVEQLQRVLEADDGRLILAASKELNPDLAGPSEERLDFEEDFAKRLKVAMDKAASKIEAALVAHAKA